MGVITQVIDIKIKKGGEKRPPLFIKPLARIMHPPVELSGLASGEGVGQDELGGEEGRLGGGEEGREGERVRWL